MEPHLLEQLLAKVGSKYKLVCLYHKRVRELMRGMPPLVETSSNNLWEIVSREILEDKIKLLTGEEGDKYRKEIRAKEAEALPALENRRRAEAAAVEVAVGTPTEPASTSN
jgi:DNA-directed RNA polymerase subunit K/omega